MGMDFAPLHPKGFEGADVHPFPKDHLTGRDDDDQQSHDEEDDGEDKGQLPRLA